MLSEELVDRYGDIPPVFDSLLKIALLKAMCHAAYITEMKQSGGEIKLTLYPKARLKTELLQGFLEQRKAYLSFALEANPYFIYKLPRKQKPQRLKRSCLTAVLNYMLGGCRHLLMQLAKKDWSFNYARDREKSPKSY